MSLDYAQSERDKAIGETPGVAVGAGRTTTATGILSCQVAPITCDWRRGAGSS